MINSENRPWGRWEEYLNEPGYRLKRIIVHSGKRLSLQTHNLRSEFWVIVAGNGKLTLNDEIKRVTKGDTVCIEQNATHRIENDSTEILVIIEIQFGICLEDDIIRLEDDWGRES